MSNSGGGGGGGWWDSDAVPPEALFLLSLQGGAEGGHPARQPLPAPAISLLDRSLADEAARYAAFTSRLEALCAEGASGQGGGRDGDADEEEAQAGWGAAAEWLGPADAYGDGTRDAASVGQAPKPWLHSGSGGELSDTAAIGAAMAGLAHARAASERFSAALELAVRADGGWQC